MAINFATGQQLAAQGSNLVANGNVVQVVEAHHTSRLATSSTSAQNFFTQAITLTNASNGVIWYYNSAQRCDTGDGPWSLGYHDMYRTTAGSGYGTGTRMFYSGYNGFTANNIIHYSKMGVDFPGITNPQYYIRVWAYPGCNVQFNSPNNQGSDGVAVLRLMEFQPL